MKNLRTSLACLALLASAAACSNANPLTAPDAPRFDGVGTIGGGAKDGGGFNGSGSVAPDPEKDGGGAQGSGYSVSTAEGGGFSGSGGKDGGGVIGSGNITSTEDGGGTQGSGGKDGGHTVGSGG